MITVRDFSSRQILYKVESGEIRDFYGRLVARYDNNYLRDVPGLIQFKFSGKEIRDYAGMLLWRLDGNVIRRMSGMGEYRFDDEGISNFSYFRLYLVEGHPNDLEKMAIFAFMLGRS